MITVKDAQVVKSYGYSFTRPGGDLASCLRNLDRWLVDEIAVIDISRTGAIDQRVLEVMRRTRVSTPLVYGGGIRSTADVHQLLLAGCDRFVVETLAMEAEGSIHEIADMVGAQALTASIPAQTAENGGFQLSIAHMARAPAWVQASSPAQAVAAIAELPVSEVMFLDTAAEGFPGSFSLSTAITESLVESLGKGVIWFGGIDLKQAGQLLADTATAGIAIGNRNLECELPFADLRRRLAKGSTAQVVRSVRS